MSIKEAVRLSKEGLEHKLGRPNGNCVIVSMAAVAPQGVKFPTSVLDEWHNRAIEVSKVPTDDWLRTDRTAGEVLDEATNGRFPNMVRTEIGVVIVHDLKKAKELGMIADRHPTVVKIMAINKEFGAHAMACLGTYGRRERQLKHYTENKDTSALSSDSVVFYSIGHTPEGFIAVSPPDISGEDLVEELAGLSFPEIDPKKCFVFASVFQKKRARR